MKICRTISSFATAVWKDAFKEALGLWRIINEMHGVVCSSLTFTLRSLGGQSMNFHFLVVKMHQLIFGFHPSLLRYEDRTEPQNSARCVLSIDPRHVPFHTKKDKLRTLQFDKGIGFTANDATSSIRHNTRSTCVHQTDGTIFVALLSPISNNYSPNVWAYELMISTIHVGAHNYTLNYCT